jgi:hypothetical protein
MSVTDTVYLITIITLVIAIIVLVEIAKFSFRERGEILSGLYKELQDNYEWLDAYELCIDWSLNTFRSPDSDSIAKLDTTDRNQLVIEVSDLILKNIIPWHKELRMYIEGYSSTLELQDRIIDIIDNSKKI